MIQYFHQIFNFFTFINFILFTSKFLVFQVLQRDNRFSSSVVSQSIPSILEPLRSDEVWWLARRLFIISCFLNETKLIRLLSRSYHDSNSLFGIISRFCLCCEASPNAIRLLNSTIRTNEPFINFRYFARYKVIIPVCLFFVLIWLLPFSYSFIIFNLTLIYMHFL